MVKNLSCVSCGSLKRFPHTFTTVSVVQLKDKHCQKPHCRNGVVDKFKQSRLHTFCGIYQNKIIILCCLSSFSHSILNGQI